MQLVQDARATRSSDYYYRRLYGYFSYSLLSSFDILRLQALTVVRKR
jgi:hypothetical protein